MTFASDLISYTGAATDAFDIRAMVRRCYLYDFTGTPVRLWDGQGIMTAGGFDWIGTMDENGQNMHKTPNVRDTRDGTSPRYQFSIPYIDKTTFDAMKASSSIVAGRNLTCYYALFQVGEGLVPSTALQFAYRLAMKGAEFSERMEGEPGAEIMVRSASIIAKSLEYGRTRVPGGTMTDTAQRERARILGISSDSGCRYVATNARRTYVIPGG